MVELQAHDAPLPHEVNEALERAGIDAIQVSVGAQRTGRNAWWIVEAQHRRYFVKRLEGPSADVQRRLKATREFELGRVQWPMRGLSSPRLLLETAGGVLIYEHIDDEAPLNIAERLRAQRVAPQELKRLGAFLAALHASGGAPSHTKAFSSVAGTVSELSLAAFIDASAGQLSVIRLLHADRDLQRSLRLLSAASDESQFRPGHGDLRVDQLVASPVGWMVCDWEEYSQLDPAWDLGSIAGDIMSTVLSGSSADFAGRESQEWEEAEVSELLGHRIRYALPLLRALLDSYVSESGGITDDPFRERMAGFCGWHLIERMLAAGSVGTSVSGLARGIGGVGRGILMEAPAFADMLRSEASND